MDNVTAVTAQTPNFNYTAPAGEGAKPGLSIRGVGINSFADTAEGPVAMYVDEVLLGALPGQTSLLFDIERVEVLRGPARHPLRTQQHRRPRPLHDPQAQRGVCGLRRSHVRQL